MKRTDSTAADGTVRRVELVTLLAAGTPWREVAERAGVSDSTIARRMREPDFRAEVLAARSVLVESALGRLASVAVRAVDTLADSLDAEHPAVRVSAARAILENLVRVREQVELSERVAELETRLAVRNSGESDYSTTVPGAEGDAA